MANPKFVTIPTHPLERFKPLLGEQFAEIERVAGWARQHFAGRAIWHVNSAARGGGVVELLGTLLPYARDAGVDVRWVVLREGPEFFAVTKRLHNHLHGDPDLHLVVAGPDTAGVADDPEGAAVYGDVAEGWRRLDPEHRRRAHLVSLPMHDSDENGAMVNAIQRRADVVVQKGVAEGFGLTVAEAMWKERPVVAGRVGGIQDQVEDGVSGLLVDDPRDLAAFAQAIESILADPARAKTMGDAARQRVIDRYLAVDRLREYVELLGALIE